MSCTQLSSAEINALIPGSGLQPTSAPWGTIYLNSLNALRYTSDVSGYPQAGILGKINYGSTPSSLVNANLSSISFPDNTSNNMNANTYKTAINSYIAELNNEYCFYYNIYLQGIKVLLEDIVKNEGFVDGIYNQYGKWVIENGKYRWKRNTSSTGATGSGSTGSGSGSTGETGETGETEETVPSIIDINAEKAIVIYMNLRCRQLLKYMRAIQQQLDTNSTSMTRGASGKNSKLNTVNTTLQEQNDKLTSNNLNSDVLQEMVSYTYEKNRYSSNLLALYGGLNIIAIALLIYIYRS